MLVSTSPVHAVATASIPPSIAGVRVPSRQTRELGHLRFGLGRKPSIRSTRLNAGLTEIEPDLEEEKRDRWRTSGVSAGLSGKPLFKSIKLQNPQLDFKGLSLGCFFRQKL